MEAETSVLVVAGPYHHPADHDDEYNNNIFNSYAAGTICCLRRAMQSVDNPQ